MEKTKYQEFLEAAHDNENYRQEIQGNGGFEYNQQVSKLMELSNKLNSRLLVYLFGEEMGCHLAIKFIECDRNLLRFFLAIDGQYKFYILHELKTNETLFAHT